MREAEGIWIGPQGGRLEAVRKIAVLRGGGLGDLLFSMPAMRALAVAYPEAEIILLGTPMHAQLLAGRSGPVHRVEVLPMARGVHWPPGARADASDLERFVERIGRLRLDLAVQLHGGGRHSNPFVSRLGARVTAGLRTPDAPGLDRFVPYVYYQHEMLRALEVAGLVGAPAVELEPRLMVSGSEQQQARALVVQSLGVTGPLLIVHPGATDPRRRWPVESFAEVAVRAIRDGARVAVIGDASDAAPAEQIVDHVVARVPPGHARIVSFAGRLGLGELAGLLSVADVLVGNDSGPRHLAQAVGCATVGIYWFGNLINAGPLGRARHRAHLSWTTRCPECGRDVTQVGWTATRCEHDVSFVADVEVDAVHADVAQLLEAATLRDLQDGYHDASATVTRA